MNEEVKAFILKEIKNQNHVEIQHIERIHSKMKCVLSDEKENKDALWKKFIDLKSKSQNLLNILHNPILYRKYCSEEDVTEDGLIESIHQLCEVYCQLKCNPESSGEITHNEDKVKRNSEAKDIRNIEDEVRRCWGCKRIVIFTYINGEARCENCDKTNSEKDDIDENSEISRVLNKVNAKDLSKTWICRPCDKVNYTNRCEICEEFRDLENEIMEMYGMVNQTSRKDYYSDESDNCSSATNNSISNEKMEVHYANEETKLCDVSQKMDCSISEKSKPDKVRENDALMDNDSIYNKPPCIASDNIKYDLESNAKFVNNGECNVDNIKKIANDNENFIPADTEITAKWNCDACTYLNNKDDKACAICETERSITHIMDEEFVKPCSICLSNKVDIQTDGTSCMDCLIKLERQLNSNEEHGYVENQILLEKNPNNNDDKCYECKTSIGIGITGNLCAKCLHNQKKCRACMSKIILDEYLCFECRRAYKVCENVQCGAVNEEKNENCYLCDRRIKLVTIDNKTFCKKCYKYFDCNEDQLCNVCSISYYACRDGCKQINSKTDKYCWLCKFPYETGRVCGYENCQKTNSSLNYSRSCDFCTREFGTEKLPTCQRCHQNHTSNNLCKECEDSYYVCSNLECKNIEMKSSDYCFRCDTPKTPGKICHYEDCKKTNSISDTNKCHFCKQCLKCYKYALCVDCGLNKSMCNLCRSVNNKHYYYCTNCKNPQIKGKQCPNVECHKFNHAIDRLLCHFCSQCLECDIHRLCYDCGKEKYMCGWCKHVNHLYTRYCKKCNYPQTIGKYCSSCNQFNDIQERFFCHFCKKL